MENMWKNQMVILELKNIITKIKSSMGGLNKRMERTEKIISELGDITMEITQSE